MIRNNRISATIIVTIVLTISSFSSCGYNPIERGELHSDGYISYSVNGKNVFIADSILYDDPSRPLIRSEYSKADSSLNIVATSSTYDNNIRIQLFNCSDTGRFELTIFPVATGQVNGYSTDSLHRGEIYLTQFDKKAGRISGTFKFSAINKSNSDSVMINNGLIFNLPITIY